MSTTEIAVRGKTVMTLNEKLQYAEKLASSGLLPTAYRRQPANILFACDYGELLGISTIAAIRGIHVIEGVPSASAALMSALVRRAGHRIRTWGDDQKAVTEIVRSDDPEFTYRSEWTIDRAVRAHLVQLKDGAPYARSKTGGPLPWECYPAALLKARSISEACRDGAEDVLMGMHYTPEEMGAEVSADGTPVRTTVASERVESERQPAESGAEPSGPDWDAEIDSRSGDRAKLLELHTLAKGMGAEQDVLDRIVEAGKAAGGHTEPPAGEPAAAESVEPDTDTGHTDPDDSVTERDSGDDQLWYRCLATMPTDWDTTRAAEEFQRVTGAHPEEATTEQMRGYLAHASNEPDPDQAALDVGEAS